MAEEQPTYKLIYFNARGRAEHIRYIFAYAGIDYVDERISNDRWPELKKAMPYGMLPVLEMNGKPIAQSNAVARYLAREHNLAGKDEWESMLCDVLVDTLGDLKQSAYGHFPPCSESICFRTRCKSSSCPRFLAFREESRQRCEFLNRLLLRVQSAPIPINSHLIFQYRTEEDLFKKEEKKVKLLKETIPFYLNKFEQTVAENNGYAVGSMTTWADFVFTVALENFENIFGASALENYPALRALKKRVHEIPAIADWLARRPHSEF
ncbi:Glutathione S-transferase [Ooceraea biroi]|uniref:glutathione transferase n=1 Tax=Ooceraea biroi TaxID=2015173 RepID=A0A026W7R7_OOCBI|nr:Glutathione S-transferase [Ooceraea biroi]